MGLNKFSHLLQILPIIIASGFNTSINIESPCPNFLALSSIIFLDSISSSKANTNISLASIILYTVSFMFCQFYV